MMVNSLRALARQLTEQISKYLTQIKREMEKFVLEVETYLWDISKMNKLQENQLMETVICIQVIWVSWI